MEEDAGNVRGQEKAEAVAIFFGMLTYKRLSEPIHLNNIVITVMR